jgi:uncharacterized protein YbbC (DUF1343 family)
MTMAELARMINGESWLENGAQCDLDWVKCANYTHDSLYKLPVKPSPNLPNMRSVYLYPSLGLFEGTIMSVGRGTEFPFQVYGHPDMKNKSFSYKPRSLEGFSSNPKYKDRICYGKDLRDLSIDSLVNNPGINLSWLKSSYNQFKTSGNFFLPFFHNLVGNSRLQEFIEKGRSIPGIKKSWQKELDQFARKRREYLLYKDFTQ